MPCWDYLKCGREEGGKNTGRVGVCPAYPDNGNNCWEVAGTYCDGKVQGSLAQKIDNCMKCSWYSFLNK